MKATIFALCLSPILSVGSIAIINNYHKWFPTMYYVRECPMQKEFLYRSGMTYYLGDGDGNGKVPVWPDADLNKICRPDNATTCHFVTNPDGGTGIACQ